MKQTAWAVAVIGCASFFVASCDDDPTRDELDASLDAASDSPRDLPLDLPRDLPRDFSPDSALDSALDSPTDSVLDAPSDRQPSDSAIERLGDSALDSSPDRRPLDAAIERLGDAPVGPTLDGSFDTSKEAPLDVSSCLDGSVCTDAGLDASVPCGTIDTAPFIENARDVVCASVQNRLSIVDCAMVFWSIRGNCADAGYAYLLFGATVDDVLCRHVDSISGPRDSSKSPVCETLFQTMIKASDKPDLGLGSGHTVTDIPF